MWAWSSAGAKIQFEKAASRRRADVVIRYGLIGSEGQADVGYRSGGTNVWIVRGLNRVAATVIAAHELGHEVDHRQQLALGGRPRDLLRSVEGMVRVVAYLDAARGRL